jgi:hypothetical protein
LTRIGRHFALSGVPDTGVFCGENGVFVGAVPLLERVCGTAQGGHHQWQSRPVSDLNRELSTRYGLSIEFGGKIDALRAVAQALGRGDIIQAQIATLHLQIPDPPALAKSIQAWDDIIDLAHRLRASGLLKADWDSAKHPRWPAGSPGGIGGEFAPAGATADTVGADEQHTRGDSAAVQSAPVIPAQTTIPVPFDFPIPPLPSEILPPPAIPDIYPRDLPQNPYPDRPECEQEWAEARSFCLRLKAQGLLGRGDYRGMGRSVSECITGQVSEDCGGNSTGT